MLYSNRPGRLVRFALAAAVTVLWLGFSFFPGEIAPLFAQDGSPAVDEGVIQALGASEDVRVIVTFAAPPPSEMGAQGAEVSIAGERADVLAAVEEGNIEVYRTFSHIPAFAAEVDAAALAALEADPRVAYIQLDLPMQAHLAQSTAALGATTVHNTYGLTGKGVRVAVLDTGIDTDHPDLQNDIVAQHCFNSSPNHGRCPNGLVEDVSAEDGSGHGTNVSGVITSDGVVAGSSRGFAPDAEIVAIRVLDNTGNGSMADTITGLNWIIAYQNVLRVDVINMSLGSGVLFTGVCDAQNPAMTSAISQLRNLGIVIFASSGNNRSTSQMVAPACISGVISVGATFDGNLGSVNFPTFGCTDATTSLFMVTCFTNSNNELDILAPGSQIRSSGRGGGVSQYSGTSQASPTAAGIAALLLEAQPSFTPIQIEAVLKSTGTMVFDARNGLSFPLINALSAIQSLPPRTPTLLSPPAGIVSDRRPTFAWSAIPIVSAYEFELQYENDTPSVFTFVPGITSYRPPANLLFGTYKWRVRAINGPLASQWSALRTTVIGARPGTAPTLHNFIDTTPTLSWNRLTWATQYEVQVDTSPNFNSNPLVFSVVLPWETLEVTIDTPLEDGTYYWRVRGLNADGRPGNWVVQSFYVG